MSRSHLKSYSKSTDFSNLEIDRFGELNLINFNSSMHVSFFIYSKIRLQIYHKWNNLIELFLEDEQIFERNKQNSLDKFKLRLVKDKSFFFFVWFRSFFAFSF